MDTKNTLLSTTDLTVLEKMILEQGKIVSFDALEQAFYQTGSITTVAGVKKRISLLVKVGWLIRLKRGLYLVITDISTLGYADVTDYAIAQAFNKDSYISFENALQYYGMFDQMLSNVESVTNKVARKYRVQEKEFVFSQIKQKLYFGFTIVEAQGRNVLMAEKEKALLDMLYFRSSSYNVDLVLEKLKEYRGEIDFKKLKRYAKEFGLTIIRKVGFLLDLIQVDTKDLYSVEKKIGGYSKMTVSSSQFNARWRLYYDSNIY